MDQPSLGFNLFCFVLILILCFLCTELGAAGGEDEYRNDAGGNGCDDKQGGEGVDQPYDKVLEAVGKVLPAFREGVFDLGAEGILGGGYLGILDNLVKAHGDGGIGHLVVVQAKLGFIGFDLLYDVVKAILDLEKIVDVCRLLEHFFVGGLFAFQYADARLDVVICGSDVFGVGRLVGDVDHVTYLIEEGIQLGGGEAQGHFCCAAIGGAAMVTSSRDADRLLVSAKGGNSAADLGHRIVKVAGLGVHIDVTNDLFGVVGAVGIYRRLLFDIGVFRLYHTVFEISVVKVVRCAGHLILGGDSRTSAGG